MKLAEFANADAVGNAQTYVLRSLEFFLPEHVD